MSEVSTVLCTEFIASVYLRTVPAKVDDAEIIVEPDVIVNRTITLFCPASGVPIPTITWTRDGEIFSENSSDSFLVDNGWRLKITPAKRVHSGKYSCKAENIACLSEEYFE